MRKVSLAFLFAFLTISAFAQDVIKVNYKGAKPTVTDFAKAGFAYFNADDGEPGDRPWKSVENAMKRRDALFIQKPTTCFSIATTMPQSGW